MSPLSPASSPPSDVHFCLNTPGGATLRLMPERAAWCPLSQTLFVADVHLGKAAVFRARGLPVPQGTTTETLERLSQALRSSGATTLVVLGDLLHAQESHAPDTLAALQAWRARHPGLRCEVVVGNHDRHAGPLHADLDFVPLPGAYLSAHWLGVHAESDLATLPEADPDPDLATRLILAGHLHPVTVLAGRRDRLRLPCFWLRGGVLTLPAFGAFTGGWDVARHTPPGGDPGLCFVVADRVMPPIAPTLSTASTVRSAPRGR